MSSELIQAGNQLQMRTPDAFENAMRPVAGVRVKEVLSERFSADVHLFQMPRTTFFSLELPKAHVVVPDGSGFVAVNFVVEGELRSCVSRQEQCWSEGTAHVVNHDRCKFDFTTDDQLVARALCFQKPLMEDYARQFHRDDNDWASRIATDSILDSSAGGCFARYANFIWEELVRGGAFLQSPHATQEIEDSLWSLLMSAVSDPRAKTRMGSGGYASYAKAAEEFIQGHLDQSLRVVEIARAVGVSVPTLNRVFRKCHGMGPKAFVKRQRLRRVRLELQNADPVRSSVTDVAMKYAFWHLSQFAVDYKKAFQETPSETLAQRGS